MKKWPTKKKNQGMVELFFSLIIFATLLWGIGHVYLILLHKGRIERSIWSYAVSRAHKTEDRTAKELSKEVFPSVTEKQHLHWTQSTNCYHEILAVLPIVAKEEIPYSFRLILPLFKCGEDVHLKGDMKKNTDLAQWDKRLPNIAPFQTEHRRDEPIPVNKSDSFIPGDDLKGAFWTKQAMWLEAMMKAGFGPIPLDSLGAVEVVNAMTFGGGGTAAKEALSKGAQLLKSTGIGVGDLTKGKVEKILNEKLKKYSSPEFKKLLGKY